MTTSSSTSTTTSPQEYGYVALLANSVPDIQKVLSEAAAGGWDVQRFQDALATTNWWKQHSDTAKQYIIMQASDPSQFNQVMTAAKAHVQQMALSMGISLSKSQIDSQATADLYQGLDDATLQANLGALYKGLPGGGAGGTAVTLTQQIQQLASEYGVPVTDSWVTNMVRQSLISGNGAEGAKESLMQQAASAYPTLAPLIQGGQTVQQIAQPYIAQMASTLELDGNAISLQDRTIQQALRGQLPSQGAQPGLTPKIGQVAQTNLAGGGSISPAGKTGGSKTGGSGGSGSQAQPQMMNLFDFQNYLRQDPRWDTTQNARDSAYTMLGQLGKDWGMST